MDSCNDALMQMSYAIGPENFSKYQQIFGFGHKTNIDLPGEARTDSLIYTLETMDDASLATNSFGQNFNVTMIQMASAFSSLINGGNYYQPHVVKKITDENGNLIEENKGELLKQTVSKDTSNMVKQYLYATVSEGTGKWQKCRDIPWVEKPERHRNMKPLKKMVSKRHIVHKENIWYLLSDMCRRRIRRW